MESAYFLLRFLPFLPHLAFMLDQCHNIEDKIPGQIRSVLNVQEMTARALLVDAAALAGGAVPPAELLQRWRTARPALAAALRDYPAGEQLPWFGPPMGPT